ncbi:MAG: thioredoxin [Bacillota bacterium]
MGADIFEVSDDTFQTEVIESDTPVLVDFWADWCAPCKMIAPVVEQIAEEKDGDLRVAKLDVDENQRIAASMGVMSIPTLILFKDGEPVARLVGFASKEQLLAQIESKL